ncbi:MAG TPA: M55 family metallopeptidase, partial [Mycobacteriales bacterium]|nr:M55 family metallopeptidase [Mycobacteriales bacterium]
GFSATESLSPEAADAAIFDAVQTAVASASSLSALTVPDQLVLEVDFASPLMADYAACVPRTDRVAALTLRGQVGTVDDLLKLVMAWYYLAALAAQQLGALVHRR